MIYLRLIKANGYSARIQVFMPGCSPREITLVLNHSVSLERTVEHQARVEAKVQHGPGLFTERLQRLQSQRGTLHGTTPAPVEPEPLPPSNRPTVLPYLDLDYLK